MLFDFLASVNICIGTATLSAMVAQKNRTAQCRNRSFMKIMHLNHDLSVLIHTRLGAWLETPGAVHLERQRL